jgi:demethoxyubiquinone hydroxylase (CLK1/Coq7/Cat5 family)
MIQGEGTTIEKEQELDKCVEYILEHKAGWTQFTRWYTETKGVGHVKANRMWKMAMAKVSETIDTSIKGHVDRALVELENLKDRARQENDRRTELDAIKYQAKISGAEIERSQVDVKLEAINLNWGTNE